MRGRRFVRVTPTLFRSVKSWARVCPRRNAKPGSKIMEFINPSTITAPASNYSQGVVVPAGGKRLIVSGQIGMTKDGKVVEGIEAQLRQTWANLLAVLKAGGMAHSDVVKV